MVQKIDKGIEKFFSIICTVFSSLNALMVIVLIGVVVLDIFSTLLKYPITITSELTGLMFAWITGLSGVIIAIKGENIALTFIKDKFKGKAIHLFIYAVTLIFCSIMFVSSIFINQQVTTQIMPLLGVSKSVIYSSMIVMFFLISVVTALQMIRYILKKGDEK